MYKGTEDAYARLTCNGMVLVTFERRSLLKGQDQVLSQHVMKEEEFENISRKLEELRNGNQGDELQRDFEYIGTHCIYDPIRVFRFKQAHPSGVLVMQTDMMIVIEQTYDDYC